MTTEDGAGAYSGSSSTSRSTAISPATWQRAEAAGDEIAIGRFGDADNTVDVLANQIDQSIAFGHDEVGLWTRSEKSRQRRQQEVARQRTVDIHSQSLPQIAAGKGRLCILDLAINLEGSFLTLREAARRMPDGART